MNTKDSESMNSSELIEMLENYLDFKRWGFELTCTSIYHEVLQYVVYQSEQCKIIFRWGQSMKYASSRIDINYGRSHALLDQDLMMWNGEKCYCWHQVDEVIFFLDGFSPVDANRSEFFVPPVVRDFSQSHKGLEQKEYIVRKNAYIWEHYGQRLFDVFDLRRPQLWSEYEKFLKEYYIYLHKQNKVTETLNAIPLYKVC